MDGPWIRLKEQEPPAHVKLLILTDDGIVREGYIDEVLLLGQVLPTRFQTVRYPDKGYTCQWQHSWWGDDPYWMICPKKPCQERRKIPVHRSEVLSVESDSLERNLKALESLTDEQLREHAGCIVQGKIQERARELLKNRGHSDL
jgi:hypothetical protein